MFGPLAKWAAQIERPERIPEYVSHAVHTAVSGRPGPVVLSLPETMLSAHADTRDAPPANPAHPSPAEADITRAVEVLRGAERPLVIAGGPGWTAEAAANLRTFAERADIPVAVSLRCQDYIDSRSPCAVGDMGVAIAPGLRTVVEEADVVLVVGARLGEMTTQGYTLFDVPDPRQTLVHVHPDASELGRVYRPDLGVVATGPAFVAALCAAWPEEEGPLPWAAWREAARERYEAWARPAATPGSVKLEEVVAHLARRLPDDAIVTNGAGNYSGWVHRYYRFRGFRTQLAPTSGSMGYGLPAAIAAKLRHPGRIAVAFAGDGCFQMTAQEFGTAVQCGAAPVVIVCDNAMYGTIRMHQERHYPGRPSGTALVNPDFARWAESYGGFGATVRDGADFPDAFEAALSSGRPAVIHLHLDPDALTTGLRLSDMNR
jgi:acetolactate synthase-1/2/3 large subunit